MDINKSLIEFKARFEPVLRNCLNEEVSWSEKVYPQALPVIKEINSMVFAGGKRLRPALAAFSYLIGSGKSGLNAVPDYVLEAGAGLEIFHDYLLIHDDIMDKAKERRGKPTVEMKFRQMYQKLPDSRHHARTAAILAGDYASMCGNKIIAMLPVSEEIRSKVLTLFFDMQREVVSGQIDDCLVLGMTGLDSLTQEAVLRMLTYKSGRYSIEKPLLIGAVLGGMDKKHLKYLEIIGNNLGLVFQISDDILGAAGDTKATGKSNATDIQQGKRTLLAHSLWLKANIEERKRIKSVFGNSEANNIDLEWVKELLFKYEVVQEMKGLCSKLTSEVHTLLEKHFDMQNTGVRFLYGFGTFLRDREH